MGRKKTGKKGKTKDVQKKSEADYWLVVVFQRLSASDCVLCGVELALMRIFLNRRDRFFPTFVTNRGSCELWTLCVFF
jgi:hypothetical protein